MKIFLIYTFSIMALLLSGCNKDKIPGVYRIDIQQGNDITQEMINKLKPGMTKNQVAYVMGTPLVIDTFHPDRWDYVYSFHPGNGSREQRRVTLFFKQDTLSHLKGDIRTVARDELPQSEQSDTSVVVPLEEKKTSVFQGLINAIGLGDDNDQEIVEASAEESTPIEEDPAPAAEPTESSQSQ